MFKAIVSGDKITAEHKFRDPFTFNPYATLIFSANRIPASEDSTHAFHRRWVVIPFERTFTIGVDADISLRRKLTTPKELSGILNRGLQGLRRLFEQGEFSIPASAHALLQDAADAGSVERFVHDACDLGPTATIAKQALYKAYLDFCQKHKHTFSPLSQFKFRERLSAVVEGLDEHRTDRGSGPWHWIGVGLR